MNTLITGASGLIGSALVESLHAKGHTLRCLQRNRLPAAAGTWKVDELLSAADDNEPFDTVIHLAGENVAQGRWSPQRKERILKSRVEGTSDLIQLLSQLAEPPTTFICASAIGYYGSRGDELLTETSTPGKGFLAEVCRQWEAEAQKAGQFGARVVNLRFGMVLSPNGGALSKMLPPLQGRRGRAYWQRQAVYELGEHPGPGGDRRLCHS